MGLAECADTLVEWIKVEYKISDPGLAMIEEVFEMIDKDGDGRITKEELDAFINGTDIKEEERTTPGKVAPEFIKMPIFGQPKGEFIWPSE